MDRHQDPAPTRTQPRLLDQVRGVIGRLHHSISTEQAYLDWIRRFILFHGKRHPAEIAAPEVEAFLSHLAVQGKVAALDSEPGAERHRVSLPAGTEKRTSAGSRL